MNYHMPYISNFDIIEIIYVKTIYIFNIILGMINRLYVAI